MTDQLSQQVALEPELVERPTDSERLPADLHRFELIGRGDIEIGLQLANVMWFIANRGFFEGK